MTDKHDKTMPRMARGRRNRFFNAEGVDDLLSMVLELTAEVSVMRQRQYAMERILETEGVTVSDALQSWQPDEQDEAWLAADRERLLGTVFRTLEAPAKDSAPPTAAREGDRARAA